MIRKVLRAFVSLCFVSSLVAQSAAPTQILGFSSANSARQIALEAKFDEQLKAQNLNDWMKRLTARPHHLGSAYNKQNADFIAAQFRSWGYDTKLEEFHVLFRAFGFE